MRASEPPGSLSTSYTRACKLGKATTLSLAEQQEQFVLNDLKTSTIGLRRGWSVSRALSWAVCFADKTRAHGNLPSSLADRRLRLRWIRGERGKSELNAGKRQFGRLQLLRPCACPQISS